MNAVAIESVPLIDVIVGSAAWDTAPDAEAAVQRALSEAAIAIGANFKDRVLAVLLTDDVAMRRLNAQWRNIDKPTNVLSFPPAANQQAGAVKSLGDIAIAYQTAAREAGEEGKPLADHLAHLAVHGFLHLLGYDHDSDAAAEQMEQLERVILARLGVPDPYLTHETLAREPLPHDIRG
jgi:probable rRNA maturation factor